MGDPFVSKKNQRSQGRRERKMPLTHKERLLKEIDEFPEETIPKLCKIIHVLRTELIGKAKKPRGSLKGIWKGSQIDNALYLESRRSLFPYEHQ